MPTFERGAIVRVPFPYTDRATRQRRPALVVSSGGVGPNGDLLWVVMITSADHRAWPGDLDIDAPPAVTGLQAPSVVRTAKIATIEARHADRIGSLQPARVAEVSRTILGVIGAG